MTTTNKLTVREVAKDLGIQPRSVWYWINKLRIKGEYIGAIRMMLLSPEEVETIKENCIKFQDGNDTVSVAMLMTELGLSKQGVWNLIHKTGLRSGSRKGAQTRFTQAEAAIIRSVVSERKIDR